MRAVERVRVLAHLAHFEMGHVRFNFELSTGKRRVVS